MYAIVPALMSRARELAEASQANANQLKAQSDELRSRAETAMAQARAAGERLDTFQPQIGDDYQCPRCWIES